MDEIDISGIPVPDAGPLFLTALTVHVAAGLTCVACGVLATLSRKGTARHRRFGRIYLWGMGVVFASMSVLSVIQWGHNAHLFVLGTLAFALSLTGYLSRRHRRPYSTSRAWAAPTSPCSRASTSTTARTCRDGIGCPAGCCGPCRACSAYP